MSKVTLFVSAKVKDEAKVNEYKKTAIAILKEYGGVLPPTSRQVSHILAGDSKPESVLEIDFPSEENIINAFEDQRYKEVIPLRDEGFYSDLSILILK